MRRGGLVLLLAATAAGQLTKCLMGGQRCNVGEVRQCCERHQCVGHDASSTLEPDMTEAAEATCQRIGAKPTAEEYLNQLRTFYLTNAPPKAEDDQALIFTLRQWKDREELMCAFGPAPVLP